LEQLLAYSFEPAVDGQPLTGTNDRGGSGIEDFLSEKVASLGTIVRDMRAEIARRARLSRELCQQIYQQYLYVKSKLLQLYLWPMSANRAIEQRRLGLEGTLDVLLREGRSEQVKCTEEIARLKGELWRWLKEYLDVRQRVRLVLDRGLRGT
jgi:hypothetical protein